MALTEKKKRAIAAAVAYMVEQEDAAAAMQGFKDRNMWVTMGRSSMMQNRAMVQRRGRALSIG